MNWKNWPYWVKGGIFSILLIISYVLFVILEISIFPNELLKNGVFVTYIENPFLFLIKNVTNLNLFIFESWATSKPRPNDLGHEIFFGTIIFSGIIIGFIYGKIKNHSKNKVNGNIS